jgi:sec-independent protein translocase protein TatA
MHLGMGEMLVVLVIALLVFGPNKLPQLGDALGKGIHNFKKAAGQGDPTGAAEEQVQQRRLTGDSFQNIHGGSTAGSREETRIERDG